MRAEYSESNNPKMIELALLPFTNLNLPAAWEIDRDDKPALLKYNDAVSGTFESNSVGLIPVRKWLDQVSDSNNMEYSRLPNKKKGVAKEGKFRLTNGIDSNSVGMTFQW